MNVRELFRINKWHIILSVAYSVMMIEPWMGGPEILGGFIAVFGMFLILGAIYRLTRTGILKSTNRIRTRIGY